MVCAETSHNCKCVCVCVCDNPMGMVAPPGARSVFRGIRDTNLRGKDQKVGEIQGGTTLRWAGAVKLGWVGLEAWAGGHLSLFCLFDILTSQLFLKLLTLRDARMTRCKLRLLLCELEGLCSPLLHHFASMI